MEGRITSARARRSVAPIVVVALIATLLAGCGWRLETPDPAVPSPDAITVARDEAALREGAIMAASELPATATEGYVTLTAIVTRTSATHLDALGGIYRAYEDDAVAEYDGSLADAVRAARDGAIATAMSSEDPDLATLLGSVGLSHAWALWYSSHRSAVAASAEFSVVQERTLPAMAAMPTSALVPENTQLSGETLMDLAVAHDQARYLYETIGARAQGDARADAWARRDIHAARSDALADLSGQTDRREWVYSVPVDSITGSDAQADAARAVEQSLGWTYASLTDGTGADDRAWLLNAAFDAYAASAVLPGFVTDEFPTLPGIELDPA